VKEQGVADKLRVGVIGSGGISTIHLRGYLDSGRYEIVGLADLEAAAMAEKNEKFGIAPRHYTDARAMLAAEKPDVVSICTWHPTACRTIAPTRPICTATCSATWSATG
jgi:predicted dehydrogenase